MALGISIEQAVARALAGAADHDDAHARALHAIGEGLDWPFAATWEIDDDGGSLRCTRVWHAPDERLAAFAAGTHDLALPPGQGLPGRVWELREPVWIADFAAEHELPRRQSAAGAGLHAALGVPIHSERGLIGVLECFGPAPLTADHELLASMEVIGGLLGQLTERRRTLAVVHAAEQRHRATLHAALDPMVTMDHEGRVIEFNPAAERVFGFAGDDAVGRDMADLIVPEELRTPHRRGLRRYLETEEPRLLDRRIEIDAVRADGGRFPVELTITRIDVPGPPVFTGQLRDITETRRHDEELRASRARIVEAADAARRRIERDLHDGAQQQLVSLAVSLRGARDRLEDGDVRAAQQLLGEADDDLRQALSELRELARGIHPSVLTQGGLDPALRGLVRRSPIEAELLAAPAQRLDAAAEAAVYFVAAEGLTNAARHAGASSVQLAVTHAEGRLVVEVRDDGHGGADVAGSGLRGLADRLAALDGTLTVVSPPGAGTFLRGEVPCAS